jgi:hypothetical protein
LPRMNRDKPQRLLFLRLPNWPQINPEAVCL